MRGWEKQGAAEPPRPFAMFACVEPNCLYKATLSHRVGGQRTEEFSTQKGAAGQL